MTAPLRARPGAIVQVRIQGVWHEGLIGEEPVEAPRPRTVIHKSKRTGAVVEEPLEDFASGFPVRVVGYPGRLGGAEVLSRARARIGEPWTVIQNCQRFTRGCHGVPSRSPDAERTIVAFTVGLLGSAILGGR